MALPENVRVNASLPFPAQVTGGGPVAISKSLGIWQVSLNFTNLATVPVNTPGPNLLFCAYNLSTLSFQQITAAGLLAAAQSTRIVTTTGAQTILNTDAVLLINVSGGPGTLNFALPASLSRVGPLTFKDIGGTAAANNITLTPNGADTIDGVNAAVVLNDNYEAMTLNPLASGGWWIG